LDNGTLLPGRLTIEAGQAVILLMTGVFTGTSSEQQLKEQQQQQQQQQGASWAAQPSSLSPMVGYDTYDAAAAAAAATGLPPTLEHPSTLPLQFEGGQVIEAASGHVLLDNIDGGMLLNAKQSRQGALVFGASSHQGPSSSWDVTVGRVSHDC
jgi:hypothetical protein